MQTMDTRTKFMQLELAVFQAHVDLLPFLPELYALTSITLIHRGDHATACSILASRGFMDVIQFTDEFSTVLVPKNTIGAKMVPCPVSKRSVPVRERKHDPGFYGKPTIAGIAEIASLIQGGYLRG